MVAPLGDSPATPASGQSVLDLNELFGVRLAFRANEDVAILIARTASLRSVADNARLDRGRHRTIFALSREPAFGGSIDAQPVEHYGWPAERRRAAMSGYRIDSGLSLCAPSV